MDESTRPQRLEELCRILSYSIDQLDAVITTVGRAVAALAAEIAHLSDERELTAELELERTGDRVPNLEELSDRLGLWLNLDPQEGVR